VREALTLPGGKELQARLMLLSSSSSIILQGLFAWSSTKYGGIATLRYCFVISSIVCISTYIIITITPNIDTLMISLFYLWFTYHNMCSMVSSSSSSSSLLLLLSSLLLLYKLSPTSSSLSS